MISRTRGPHVQHCSSTPLIPLLEPPSLHLRGLRHNPTTAAPLLAGLHLCLLTHRSTFHIKARERFSEHKQDRFIPLLKPTGSLSQLSRQRPNPNHALQSCTWSGSTHPAALFSTRPSSFSALAVTDSPSTSLAQCSYHRTLARALLPA